MADKGSGHNCNANTGRRYITFHNLLYFLLRIMDMEMSSLSLKGTMCHKCITFFFFNNAPQTTYHSNTFRSDNSV